MLPNHFRIPRPVAVLLAGAIVVGGVLVAAPAAQAADAKEVTVTIPSRIVIDGGKIPVDTKTSGYFYEVSVVLYRDGVWQTSESAAPNTQMMVSTSSMKPGSIVGRVARATEYCSWVYDGYCSLDDDFRWYHSATGLKTPDSATATAKYGSKVDLSATTDGTTTTWTASVQRYGWLGWEAWNEAPVTIGSTTVSADAKGIATWVERTNDVHTLTASVPETDTIWSSASSAVSPTKVTPARPVSPTPVSSKPSTSPKPGHIAASATASKAATALKKGLPSVRKVVTLTKKNDGNKLLGKSNGYVSAAVLYDRSLSCSGGPGVDCGATVEKFTSTAKAKARKSYIQRQLRKYSFLGDEYDVVHGKFLLRVSGDMATSRISTYKKAFSKAF